MLEYIYVKLSKGIKPYKTGSFTGSIKCITIKFITFLCLTFNNNLYLQNYAHRGQANTN